jgi:hypothetical protein
VYGHIIVGGWNILSDPEQKTVGGGGGKVSREAGGGAKPACVNTGHTLVLRTHIAGVVTIWQITGVVTRLQVIVLVLIAQTIGFVAITSQMIGLVSISVGFVQRSTFNSSSTN